MINNKTAINRTARCVGIMAALFSLQVAPGFVSSAFAEQTTSQSLLEISNTAEQFALASLDASTYSDVVVTTQALDPRLRLKQCENPLQASTNNATLRAGRTTVNVRCDGVSPWSLYVPVTISANAAVVMIKGPVTRGTVLGAGNLAVVQMPVAQLPPNYLSDITQVSGRELSRAINGDTYATVAMLKEKNMIQKGQEVIILAQSASFQVRMSGTALENGQSGERISVKNNNSGRTVEGKVVAENVIAVGL
ncbi:MAG: flagellar basal body P-ring formation chaperone FlgA [Pseudomonadota bacterium]